MSYKTERLVDLFPDAYAAKDAESLLYKLLDALGAELMAADEAVKRLLKSHWVNYAAGPALDGLAAIYGVSRRALRGGGLESDPAFRLRLKSVVEQFTGGGTLAAVKGAVRSALGLPFNLEQLHLPADFAALRQAIEDLVEVREFAPTAHRVVGDGVTEVDQATGLILPVDAPAVKAERPQIRWTFTRGGGRRLSVERVGSGTGIAASEELLIPEGVTLVLSPDADGRLSAFLGTQEVTPYFTNLDRSTPALMPEVPPAHSDWKFRASGGLYDASTFDEGDIYELPQFHVEMVWTRYEPLTFEVHVPYFLQKAVRQLKDRYGYPGEIFVFEGLPPDRIQGVVDQTRAAGVRASVHFSLSLADRHDPREALHMQGRHRWAEDAAAYDELTAGSVNRLAERQDASDRLVIAAVFDVSPFDGGHGFI